MKAVVAKGLVKRFGSLEVLRGISFEVEESEIFGLIGPNGAGKTTTLRILATILKPDLGDAWIMGYSVRDEASEVRKNMAYLPEDAGVYRHLTGLEFPGFMGRIRDALRMGSGSQGSARTFEAPWDLIVRG